MLVIDLYTCIDLINFLDFIHEILLHSIRTLNTQDILGRHCTIGQWISCLDFIALIGKHMLTNLDIINLFFSEVIFHLDLFAASAL